MKNILKQLTKSSQFKIGFIILFFTLLIVILYPLIVSTNQLEMIGKGIFYKPGTYICAVDTVKQSISKDKSYVLNIDGSINRLSSIINKETRIDMIAWLEKYGGVEKGVISDSDADISKLINAWHERYDVKNTQKGLIAAKKKYYARLDKSLKELLNKQNVIIAEKDEEGKLSEQAEISDDIYVNVTDVPNRRTFWLGTDNFGRDVLTELIYAIGTSLKIGLIAGIVATGIGLIFGLFAGFVGGIVDDLIMFITNLFTVIPSFIILILISYSVGQQVRGVGIVAVIIGLTSWPWTTRSVRSQVISLRNRDHVNMSKLSGHGLIRIIFVDILPYMASYVVMAFILQISSGILAEAQLSMLGLGPATTTTATLGLMMNWAMTYTAHLNGSWWAYFPVIFAIAIISFSLNLMNTGMDQVFNPTLRE